MRAIRSVHGFVELLGGVVLDAGKLLIHSCKSFAARRSTIDVASGGIWPGPPANPPFASWHLARKAATMHPTGPAPITETEGLEVKIASCVLRITVVGEGDVNIKPDIAKSTIGVETIKATVK